MSESVEMSLGVALVLDEVVRKVLFAVKEENGEQVIIDRVLPFRLRYRLNKNRLMLDKDVEWFNQQKMLLLAQYGEATEDNKSVVINDPKKLELYKERVGQLIDTKISHELVELEPEDIELIEDPDITVSPDAMSLFIGYLTNDPDLEKELAFEINVKSAPEGYGKLPEEEPKEEVTEEVKKEDVVKVEEVVEEPKVEEVKPAKTSKKKTTAKVKKADSGEAEAVKASKKSSKKDK